MGERADRTRGPIPFAWVAAALVVLLAAVVAVRVAAGGSAGPEPVPPRAGGPPSRTPSTSPAATLVAPPPCEIDDRLTATTDADHWDRTVLDTTFRLDPSYVPPDLVSAEPAGFGKQYLVRGFLIEDLAALGEEAERMGHAIDLIAAYRSYVQQADLFARRVQEVGEQEALRRTARPGHSEHQLGTAVDFRTAGEPDVTEAWAATPEGRWVEANAARFGFVQSYPRGATDRTCYTYEPWHYRYLGRGLAGDVLESGLTLREYLWHWQETGSPPA